MSEADIQDEYPHTILVDLSSACNARCVMCPTQLNPLRKKLIAPELFESLVEQVAKLPYNSVFFIGVHGEPLLDKKLADKIRFCRSKSINNVLISSNGSLLDSDRARDILSAQPWILTLSLESMDPAIYESIRQGLDHGIVVENIRNAIAIRNEINSPTRIAIRFIVSSQNAHEVDAFRTYWEQHLDTEKGDYFAIDAIHNWGYGHPGTFHGSTPCPHTDCSTILSDGSVVFCCLDHSGVHYLGNITEMPLLDIYRSEKAKMLREMHRSGRRHLLEMCKTCDVAERWSGKPFETLYDTFKAKDWVELPPM